MQCIENCEVVPVNCPDSVCKLKGSLDQIEISSILLSEHLKEQADNVNPYSYSLDDGLKFYNRYLKLCENIGTYIHTYIYKYYFFYFFSINYCI